MKGNIVVLDLQTSGSDPNRDQILTISAERFIDGITLDSIQLYLKTENVVSNNGLKVTGINPENLENALDISNFKEQIINFLQDAVLAGHNNRVGLMILQRNLDFRLPNIYWDTDELSRIFFPNAGNYNLPSLAAKINGGSSWAQEHSQMTNVQLIWEILRACWEKGKQFDLSFYDKIDYLSDWDGNSFFQTLRKEIIKSFPDRPIRTDLVLASSGEGMFSYQEPEENIPDSEKWLKNCFMPGGLLEQSLYGYESRSGQIKMAQEIVNGLTSSKHVVIEAGTGTGKSYAYLIPSLWWAKKNGEKVIVATHTIPLQEQLHKKDLPVLQRVLPFNFKSVVLKGRNNYLCLKNWMTSQKLNMELTLEDRLALLSISVWLRETATGDLQELPQTPSIMRVWKLLNSENDNCIPTKCSYSGKCFLLRIRKQAEEADLVIINHSLLYSDVKTDYKVLPEFKYLIIDEAHNLHQSAFEQLGMETNLDRIVKLMEKIYRPMGPSLVSAIKSRADRMEDMTHIIDEIEEKLSSIPNLCKDVREQAKELFDFLAQIIGEKNSLRLAPSQLHKSILENLMVQAENVIGRIHNLQAALKRLSSLISLEENELDNFRYELEGYDREIKELTECISQLLSLDNLERVNWLEKTYSLYFKSSPVEVSSILKEKIFTRLNCAVLTSATLSINGSFEHFLKENGLPSNTLSLQVDSPFDYEHQMRFLVLTDLSIANYGNVRVEEVSEFIAEVAKRMAGRTLVLFTSHSFLRSVYVPLREKLDDIDIELFAQGIDGARGTILENFKNNPKSVLLGASSFWEGIDIPGKSLSCVILLKLPFWPPSLPLIEARSERLKAQGHNAFQELLLPDAIIRLKQGFGRLIRSKEDRGVVILMDARVREKTYGKLFLSSLPIKSYAYGNRLQILSNIEEWTTRKYSITELS